MPQNQNQNQSQGSTSDQPQHKPQSSGTHDERPVQPEADRARPPHGYDDPLRRERNSGLLPADDDAEPR
jgi:hypothetical protein